MTSYEKTILVIGLVCTFFCARRGTSLEGQPEAIEDNKESKTQNGTEQKEISTDFIISTTGHMLVLGEFEAGEIKKKAWLMFDTGTTGALLVSPAFVKQLKTRTPKLTIGGFKPKAVKITPFRHPGTKMINDRSGEELKGFKYVGIIGYPLVRNKIYSLDYGRKKIIFRDLTSKQKTLFPRKPLAEVTYRADKNTIWFPVTINEKVEGYAHVDSGYRFSWVEKSKVDGPVTSYAVGGFNFAKYIKDLETNSPAQQKRHPLITRNSTGFKFRPLNQARNYPRISRKLNLIANIGSNFMRHVILTVDPKQKKLYFESLPEKLEDKDVSANTQETKESSEKLVEKKAH